MQRLTYLLFYAGINLFRLVPLPFLYIKSWFAYVVVYHLVAYRKKVVYQNLAQSFPEKSSQEITQITKRFYKNNLSQIFVEGLKGFTMSKKQFKKHYQVLNPEVLSKYYEKGQDVIALATHYCNWEWGIQAVDFQIQHQAAALYKPLTNRYVEKYTLKLRHKMGMEMVPVNKTRVYFEQKKEKPVLYIMAADQREGALHKAGWVKFMGQDTACLLGPEKYAKYNNLPLVFFDVRRVKRGYYTLEIKELCTNPLETDELEITTRYMQTLEQIIREKPEDWLWSHKRWKDKKPSEQALNS